MTLLDRIAAKQHTPTVQVYLDSRQVPANTIVEIPRITYDLDARIAEAEVRLKERPSWFAYMQKLEIKLGWDGWVETAFKGEVPEQGLLLGPSGCTIIAQGALARLEAEVSTALGKSWDTKTQAEIIGDCMDDVGITQRDLDGDATTLGTIEPITLTDGESYASLVSELDQAFSYVTFDCPDGVVRRRLFTGQPTAGAAFAFTEGGNILGSAQASGSVRSVRNRVVVTGHPDGEGGAGVYAARQAASTLIPTPPQYRVFKFDSPLIETDALADDPVAIRLMLKYNRPSGTVTFRTPGNPYLIPCMTIAITAASLDLAAANYPIRRVTHSLTRSGGFVSEISTEGGVGDAGYATGRPPVAMFTYTIEKETVLIAGVPTIIYVVSCESASTDLDDAPDTLTLAWANDQNATTGSASIYTVVFSEAEMAAKPIITLTVTDDEANTDAIALQLDTDVDTVIVRAMFLAMKSRAYATPDGWASYATWAHPSADCISTALIAPVDNDPITGLPTWALGVYGYSNGDLYYTEDFLVSAPTLLKNFGSAVNSICINESDWERCSVGLENGEVWLTEDLSSFASATWVKLRTFADPVTEVNESAITLGLFRVCSGVTEWIGEANLAGVYAGATFPATSTATRVATSFAGNYAAAIAASGTPVKVELGADLTVGAETDVRALTHDIRRARLYILARGGATYTSDDDAAAVGKTAVPGATGVNHAIRDGDMADIVYACDETAGLMKTVDGMASWYTVVAGNGTTLCARMVGYGSVPLVPPELPATGRRVLVVGKNAAENALYAAFTENIWAPSPVWVTCGTGLPAVAYVHTLVLDRDDPGNIAYVLVGTAAGYGNAIYRNSSYRTGGTWTKIFDVATYDALVGRTTAAGSFQIGGIDTGPGGLLLFTAYHYVASADGFVDAIHSHDNGATFTKVQLLTAALGTWIGPGASAIGLTDPDVMYCRAMTISWDETVFASADGGHTFPTWNKNLGTNTLRWWPVVIFKQNNDDDAKALVANTNTTGYKTTDAWATDAAYNPQNIIPVLCADGNVAAGYDGSQLVYISGDEADSFGSSYDFGAGHEVRCVRNLLGKSNRWYCTRANTDNAVLTCTLAALNTWVDRTGNLLTIMDQPWLLAVDELV